MAKNEGSGNRGEYFERLAIYLIFAVCAFFSIIIWVFNWICWNRKCCCFDAFDDYCNKVFVWWLSWIFLCGVLACCIAGFFTANRFGFTLYGTQCAYERIYDDIMYGQYKTTYPKWEGKNVFLKEYEVLKNITIKEFKNTVNFSQYFIRNYTELDKNENFSLINNLIIFPFPEKIYTEMKNNNQISEEIIIDINTYIQPFVYLFNNFYTLFEALNSTTVKLKFDNQFSNLEEFKKAIINLEDYKTIFINDFTYYINVAKAMGKIVPIIYFALLLTFVVASGALLITYFCIKVNQQWWILPMHIAWNGLRFFIFSFFMYGCAYGMLFLGAKDSIAYLKYGAFDENNLKEVSDKVIIIPEKSSRFFEYCLLNNPAYEDLKNNNFLNEFVKNGIQLRTWIKKNTIDCPKTDLNIGNKCDESLKDITKITLELIKNYEEEFNIFQKQIDNGYNIYDNWNCSFINNNLNLMYRAMWDFAWETRILCALSCCIGFFGAIAVYSFLWAMHLWKREDNNYSGYSSFNNNKKTNKHKPSKNTKKKKIAPPKDMDDESQSELTKKNNEYNNNNDNDNDED